MRNNKQTVPTTKNTSTTPDETIIYYRELSDEDAYRVVGGGACWGPSDCYGQEYEPKKQTRER